MKKDHFAQLFFTLLFIVVEIQINVAYATKMAYAILPRMHSTEKYDIHSAKKKIKNDLLQKQISLQKKLYNFLPKASLQQ